MYALIDCNNFFVSCERLFRPDLRNKPVVVLSNNDGAIISRSNEAKSLGIKMGEPFFKIKKFCTQHNIQIFSSNYTLYRDLSQRVMSVIEDSWSAMEIYSIDEAFLDLTSIPKSEIESFCSQLQQKVLRYTGIPVTVGIGSTKTRAKLANLVAKKHLYIPIFNLELQPFWLKKIAINEVWGIGGKWHKKLIQQGICTAEALATQNIQLLRKQYNVIMMRIAMELQGICCASGLEKATKKSILSSRSFGMMQSEYSTLAEALSSHCANVYTKLRQQKSLVQSIYVFVKSNRFREDLIQYNQSILIKLANPTDDLRIITALAKQGLDKIYKPHILYKKIGLCLEDLIDKDHHQLDLFDHNPQNQQKSEQCMTVVDAINQKFGRHTIKLAAQGFSQSWQMKADLKSPAYTTQWQDLAIVKNRT